MTIIALVAIMLFTLSPAWDRRAQASPSLTLLTALPITIASGGSQRINFRLTNDTSSAITYSITAASVPAGIMFSFPDTQSQLVPANSIKDFNIDFNAPSSSGNFRVTVQANGTALSLGVDVTVTGSTATPTTSTVGPLSITPVNQTITGTQGQQGISANVTVSNNTDSSRTVILSATELPKGVTVRFPIPQLVLQKGASFQFPLLINYSGDVPLGQNIGTGRIIATAKETPSQTGTAFLTFVVSGATATPQPACPGNNQREVGDPGDSKSGAKRLLVNETQTHGICVIGDQDWYVFGAVGGKVYTFDIVQMDFGIDLSLELFDANDQLVASNDDFYARTPVPGQATATPGASGDLRPRIQSWRSPANGDYYLRVRDNLNIGGNNKNYTIVVVGESYGPTPNTVYEICRDKFEEDGLPEQAKLIVANEIQPAHVLCPVGDADWVKFFGKAGKTYYLFTDTRPYKNVPEFNNQTEAGADTVIYLADRDGTSIIDFNDDIEGSLDSQIRFIPRVDGFYYLQVKNSGDIGNQFIRYDLTMQLCVPNQECGRAPQPIVAPTQQTGATSPPRTTPTVTTPTATFGLITPTLTPQTFGDGTPTITLTPLAGQSVGQQVSSGALMNGPGAQFADAAFEQTWRRNDAPVASGGVARGWLWGPAAVMARGEEYRQVVGGLRQVQYFDKGRMEINSPGGDRSSLYFVTSGLLVNELIGGKMQIGDVEFADRGAAQLPIAGDPDDTDGPTYASFAGAMAPVADRTGSQPRETLGRDGRVGIYTGPQRPETQLTRYVPQTGHAIPEVFWRFMQQRGRVLVNGRATNAALIDWTTTLGYPLSEPYWATVRLGGQSRTVLIQPYQRRVLTYTPDNAAGWQVEMGNVGRHYYQWRYGEMLP